MLQHSKAPLKFDINIKKCIKFIQIILFVVFCSNKKDCKKSNLKNTQHNYIKININRDREGGGVFTGESVEINLQMKMNEQIKMCCRINCL